MRLLVSDLDNTLYDWVTYFSHSFAAMVAKLSLLLEVSEDELFREFRVVHQKHHNSEHPYALLEIDSVRARFPGHSRAALLERLDPALHAFNSARKRTLRLYPNVRKTLETLHRQGVRIVGHTEASIYNAFYRVVRLDLYDLLIRLYALEGSELPHPNPGRKQKLELPPAFIKIVPRHERKPNPELLLDICAAENIPPGETVYVGDSITRDVSMAVAAGVKAVWARYGCNFDRSLWDTLVRVTHWTAEDVEREEHLRERFATTTPDYVIDRFEEILTLFPHRPRT